MARREGALMAAIRPMMATTIMISINVNAWHRDFLAAAVFIVGLMRESAK
jgi:hypothetical protein